MFKPTPTTMQRADYTMQVTIDPALLDHILDYAKMGVLREFERRAQVIVDFDLSDDHVDAERERADRWLERIAEVRYAFINADAKWLGESTTDEA